MYKKLRNQKLGIIVFLGIEHVLVLAKILLTIFLTKMRHITG